MSRATEGFSAMQTIILYFLISVGKDSERREQRQTENEVFRFDYAELHPILGKYRERQVQKQTERNFQVWP
jgi:hypothetical protein